jgi:hypothetical protein
MKAGEYGIKNLKWIVPQLQGWLNEKGENFENLSDVYNEVISQFSRYNGHVVTNIGGVFTDYKTTDQEGPVYTVVPKAQQKEAMAFLQKQLFQTPTWLLDASILSKVTAPTSDRVSQLQDQYLGSLLSSARMQRLVSGANRDASAYKIDEFMDDLKAGIWSELPSRKAIDAYRRNLQKSFVERISNIVNPPAAAPALGGITIRMGGGPAVDPKSNDIMSVAKGTLRQLKAEIAAAIPTYGDRMSKLHLQDLNERIDRILNPR